MDRIDRSTHEKVREGSRQERERANEQVPPRRQKKPPPRDDWGAAPHTHHALSTPATRALAFVRAQRKTPGQTLYAHNRRGAAPFYTTPRLFPFGPRHSFSLATLGAFGRRPRSAASAASVAPPDTDPSPRAHTHAPLPPPPHSPCPPRPMRQRSQGPLIRLNSRPPVGFVRAEPSLARV